MRLRSTALVLVLMLAAPAGADEGTWHRVHVREHAGWPLALVGVGGLVLTIAGVVYFGARSGNDLGSFLSALPATAAMTSVGGFVAATALPAGTTLLYEADRDRKALALDLGPDYFAARRERRVRLGRRLALAGGILALVGGAIGLTVVFRPGPLDPPVYLSLSTLGVAFGASGLALASAGIVLWRF